MSCADDGSNLGKSFELDEDEEVTMEESIYEWVFVLIVRFILTHNISQLTFFGLEIPDAIEAISPSLLGQLLRLMYSLFCVTVVLYMHVRDEDMNLQLSGQVASMGDVLNLMDKLFEPSPVVCSLER